MAHCNCYRIESKTRYTYHPITSRPIPQIVTVGVCWGTKEIDECGCGGDESKCDFYPQVRESAKKETEVIEYYVIRDKDTGLYYRGKGVNRWGKYFNQVSIYRIKGQVNETVNELSRRGVQVEIVPIRIVETNQKQ